MKTKNQYRHELVEHAVTLYFHAHAIEIYEGISTTAQIITHVRQTLSSYGFAWSAALEGETFDTIRLLGPECGKAEQWLLTYGHGIVFYKRPSMELLKSVMMKETDESAS